MRRMQTILHLYLIVAISLHLLWLISNTTKRPTTSEFFQLFRTSAKFFQSAFLVILYHAVSDARHSLRPVHSANTAHYNFLIPRYSAPC